MKSCVRALVAGGGTAPFTDPISGITDAKGTGGFAARTIILLGGNTAGVNTLSYHGMVSSNSAGDSGYHWDLGISHDANSGARGGGICHDFNLKISSTADGYGYPFLDTWPDIFFGGYIGGFGYPTNVQAGSFDINWARRDRSGDAKLMICLGGTDYSAQQQLGVVNGVIATSDVPQGVLQFDAKLSTQGSGPTVTGAGGSNFEIGWSKKTGNASTTINGSFSQGDNDRMYWLDRFNDTGAYISAYGLSSYTVAGASGSGGGVHTTFMGADVVVESGNFELPAADGAFGFNLGLDAAVVLFQTVGLPLAQVGVDDRTQAQFCLGAVDPALSQVAYWTGDTTVGNGVPILGARILVDTAVLRTGTANGAATTFANHLVVTSLTPQGDIAFTLSGADGTRPVVAWWAIGAAAAPPPPVNPGAGFCVLPPPALVPPRGCPVQITPTPIT